MRGLYTHEVSTVWCIILLSASSRWFLNGCTAFQTPISSPALQSSRSDNSPARYQINGVNKGLTAASSSTAASEVSSTQIGKTEVDMNQYNLDEDLILEEWIANIQAANDMNEAGVFLGAKNSKDHFVDTLKMVVPFPQPGQGLGIELLELAGGGRSDGLGITIVTGLISGKCAESSGLRFGDSIAQISLRRRVDGNSLEEIQSVSTECLAYDETIDSILSLLQHPAAEDQSDPLFLVFTVKRLRRKPKVKMTLQYPPSQHDEVEEPEMSLELFAGENLRRALLLRGVKLNDPLARRFDNGGTGDCGAEGTCATCAVSVVQGAELLNSPGDSESQILTKRNPRWRMACKTIVGYGMREGEMVIRVNPKQWSSDD